MFVCARFNGQRRQKFEYYIQYIDIAFLVCVVYVCVVFRTQAQQKKNNTITGKEKTAKQCILRHSGFCQGVQLKINFVSKDDSDARGRIKNKLEARILRAKAPKCILGLRNRSSI